MKDIYELLRQKEFDLERVRGEVEALLLVLPLLEEAEHVVVAALEPTAPQLYHRNRWPLKLGELPPVFPGSET
jgi:hypothetical protein